MPQAQQAQLDFSYGIVRDASPHLIDPRAVYDLMNGLLDKSGSPYKRGGTVNKSNAAFGSNGLRFITDVSLLPGQRTLIANGSDFGVLSSDDATVINLGSDGLGEPKSTALMNTVDSDGAAAPMLFIGGGFIYAGSRKTGSYSTGTVTVAQGSYAVTGSGTSWASSLDAGMLFQIGNDRIYVIASVDSDTQITLADKYEGSNGSGLTYVAHNIYKITLADPYLPSEVYAVCNNRLVCFDKEQIIFSEIEKPHDYTIQIAESSIQNEHRLPQGARVRAAATVGDTLLIFSTAGIWSLDGLAFDIVDWYGNTQHRLKLVTGELSLISPAGLAQYNSAIIAPCLDGVYLLDGVSTPERISAPIDELYRLYISKGYMLGQSAVFNAHYFLPILTGAGDANRDLLVCKLDRPIIPFEQPAYPWTRFSGAGGNIAGYAVRTPTTVTQPLLLGAESQSTSRVVDCSTYFTPGPAYKNDADGTTHPFLIVTRDYETGSLTENVVRFLGARVEMLDAASDNPMLDIEYGFGINEQGGEMWDFNDWADNNGNPPTDAELVWEDDDDTLFIPITNCSITEEPGLKRQRCPVNERCRFIRFRLRNDEPVALLRLRSLELFVRESNALRR